jgi:hypothetical protein
MFTLFRREKETCISFRDALNEAEGATTVQAFLAEAPSQLRAHAAACEDCREALEELFAARLLLSALPPQASAPRPWFASKVMSAIAAREAESHRLAAAWAMVPKLASRLAWFSAVAILVAGTWLYRKPVISPSSQNAPEASVESIFETSPPLHQDDVLVSPAEKNQ